MDRLSTIMLRASFIWLLAGIIIGALMLIDRSLPGQWRLWAAPTHGHLLFVGWFLRFAMGIAYWLLPRRRSPDRPAGYHERFATIAVMGLNLGLFLRVIGEPVERAGHAGDGTLSLLTASAGLQVVAVAVFVVQLWPRVGPRATRTHRLNAK
jgi:hypothetical protein